MARKNLKLRFHGYWSGLEYKEGDEEIITVPTKEGIFDYLLETVHHSVLADMSKLGYIIHGLVDVNGVGKLERKKLKNDDDVLDLFGESQIPVVFVSLRRINYDPSFPTQKDNVVFAPTNYGVADPNTPTSFVNLLNLQNNSHQKNKPPGMCYPYFPQCQNDYPQHKRFRAHVDDSFVQESIRDKVVVDTDFEMGDGINIELTDNGVVDAINGGAGVHVDVDEVVGDENEGDNEVQGDENGRGRADEVENERGSQQMHNMFEEFIKWWGGNKSRAGSSRNARRPQLNQHDTTINEVQECRSSGRWLILGALNEEINFRADENRSLLSNSESISVGSMFRSKEALTIAVGIYHIDKIGSYRTKYSDNRRLTVICNSQRCPFTISASGKESVWRVYKVIDHICTVDPNWSGLCRLPSKVLGAFFAPRLLEEKSTLVPKSMISELQQRNSVHVSYDVALRAKHHAIGMIYGNEKESFSKLPSYLHMLKESNPGSFTALKVDSGDNKFKNAFFALGASISGFRDHGRPVIVIDGTHLKGKYNGILFVATTLDGNKQIFPLAVGIGHLEDDLSWTWFMEQLKICYGTPDDLVIVSDAHKSIKNAISMVYPTAYHCLCYVHIKNNIRAAGKSVVNLFYRAAYSFRVCEYNDAMKQLQALNLGVYEKLLGIGPERWAQCKCPARRYEFMTSNAAECFNSRAVWARKLPITSVFEVLRSIFERWFFERRSEALSRDHEVSAVVADELNQSIKDGSSMNVDRIDNTKFKVKDGIKIHIVDLTAKTCTCCQFNLMLIPCSHAAAAARKINHNIFAYVDDYYKIDSLRGMWSGVVMPISEPACWEVPPEIENEICLPPDRQRQGGRPRQSRYSIGSTSVRRTQICSRCGRFGHNNVTCHEYITTPTLQSQEVRRRRGPKKCSICRSTEHTRRKCHLYAVE